MSSDTPIRSRENPLLKRVTAVLAGREKGWLVLEGERLVEDAQRAGHALETVLVSEDRRELLARYPRARVVDSALFARISSLESSPGILALGPQPASARLDSLEKATNPLLLVVAGIADPRNLGALARSAEAFGVNAMAVCAGGVSPWNPKALRGSMGSLLRLPLITESNASQLYAELRTRGYRQVQAATRGGADPRRFAWSGRIALWLTGETGQWELDSSGFEHLSLPMNAPVESLNVTVAGSLLLFCAHYGR
jgi:RNA methyltransferase, TrmH family